MIAEIGHYALALAFFVALAQTVVPLYGAARRDPALMGFAAPAASAQFLCIAISFGALTHAFVTSDFSVSNVAENSHSLKPLLYKISGVWGNHEGSMLFWVLILALFGFAVAAFGRQLPESLKARVISIQGLIGLAFLGFILLTSNPFERLDPAPLDGRDLNPLLQDPGLAFHPPMLYVGYVGFSLAFSFAMAALIEGKVDPAWARWVRPWTLAAWTFLTAGITLGSWWAYYELGWGGWWFWDPVENASFMPWLAGTALLHSAIVVEKRDALKAWTILLAIITFSLSLMGTFLVRSGILTSVHAFAVDPERGLYILGILIVAVGGSLTLFAVRAPALKASGLFAPVSREGGLVLNNLILSVATATVFIGTLYPLFLDAMTGDKVSVGAPFFNATFVPVMIPLLVLLAIGPLLPWKRGNLRVAIEKLWVSALFTVVVAGGIFVLADDAPLAPVLGFGFAAWVAGGVVTELAERIRLFRVPLTDSLRRVFSLPGAAYGMSLAHIGIAIFICGATGETNWTRELVVNSKPGDTLSLGQYELVLESVDRTQGPNYFADTATLSVSKNGAPFAVLHPERRLYPVQQMPTTEAAIRSGIAGDLYVAIGEGSAAQGIIVRVWVKPLVPWIWVGALMMVIGGLFSLSDRRLRVGAPKRSTRRPGGPAVAEGAD
ncbi:heme lyase CcmF/NrfE family subunit [Nisaea acidiphila]|uniref:Heme lyase CcmF/NrfE family subunit n=1 Tax=Nisaea acidiphila TaxID=1862145 RepID=A0A9J7AWF6_9PROT|nr:heme lyase CcmF/NrfE family subunit [Nisaea acidiphila]UUX51446.1 heme lyase CcmF/NrfE family subunit [Nisaea acidiphila]